MGVLNMKKILALLLALSTIVIFAACSKFTCSMCGQEKSGKKTTTNMMGQEITICEDCASNPLGALGGMFN